MAGPVLNNGTGDRSCFASGSFGGRFCFGRHAINTFFDVKEQARSLVGDPMGDFCTDAYLVPKINVAYGSLLLQLQADADSTFQEAIRDVPALDVGTTNLGNWQAATMALGNGATTSGPLVGIFSPFIVEWKIAGQPDSTYREANRKTKLPNLSPAEPMPTSDLQWEWRGGLIFLTPMSVPMDLRVSAYFCNSPLVKDSDRLGIHPLAYIPVAFNTAALIGMERNNQTWIGYGDQGKEETEKLESILVKAEQGTVTRLGRASSGAYGGSYWR